MPPSLAKFMSGRKAASSSSDEIQYNDAGSIDPAEQQASIIARGLAANSPGTAQYQRYQELLKQYGAAISPEILDKYGLPHENKGEGGNSIMEGVLGGAMDVLDYVGRPASYVRAAAQGSIDVLKGKEGTNVLTPWKEGFNAFTGHNTAPTFTQLVKQDPNAKPEGILGWGVELAGTTATDPLTYVSFGAKTAAGVALRGVAEEFGPQAAKSILANGVKKTVEEEGSTLTREALEEGLMQNAIKHGAEPAAAAKGAAKSMKALDTAQGGMRFMGQRLPGTSGFMASKIVDPAETTVKEGALNTLRNVFRNNVATESRFGRGVSGAVSEAESSGKGVTERLVSAANKEVTPVAFNVTNTEMNGPLDAALRTWHESPADALVMRAELSPEGQQAFDTLTNMSTKASALATEIGIKSPELGDGLTAPAIMSRYEDVARQAGFQHSVNSLTGLKDDLGQQITFSTDELMKEAGWAPSKSLIEPSLSGPRMASSVAESPTVTGENLRRVEALAEAKGLSKIESGTTSMWVPHEIADDVKGTIKTFTTDAGSRAMKSKIGEANQLWRAYATVFPTGLGFFTRNGLGNIMNMFYAGAHPAAFAKALNLTRKMNNGTLSEAERTVVEHAINHNIIESGYFMRETSGAAQEAARALKGRGATGVGKLTRKLPLGEEAADSAVGRKVGQLAHSLSPTNPENIALRAGRHINTSIENNARLALFIDGMDKGMAPAEAAIRTKKYLFDYTNLSEAERNHIKPWVAFYTFMRKNIPLQFDTLIHNPGKIALQVHALQSGQLGPLGGATFDPHTGPAPNWALEAGGIPMGGHLIAADLPLLSAADTMAPFIAAVRDAASGRVPDIKQTAAGAFAPMSGVRSAFIKGGAEAITGQNLFTGAELKDNADKWDVFLGELLPGYGKAKKFGDQIEDISSGKDRTQALNILTGIKSTDVNAKAKLAEDWSRLDRVKQVTEQLGALPDIDDVRRVGLLPTIKKGKGEDPDEIVAKSAQTPEEMDKAMENLKVIIQLRAQAKALGKTIPLSELQRLGLLPKTKSIKKNSKLFAKSIAP